MTLVVLEVNREGFLCAADTRISGSGTTYSDSYSKIFIIPVRVEFISDTSKYHEHWYRVGIAFASNSTLFAQSCIGLISGVLFNINKYEFDSPDISFSTIIYFIEKVIKKSFDDARFGANPPSFEIMVFGICPRTKNRHAHRFDLEIIETMAQVRNVELSVEAGTRHSIGSGKRAFEEVCKKPLPSFWGATGMPERVYQAILEGGDHGTGGGISIVMITEKLQRIFPVIHPVSAAKNETKVFTAISGLVIEGERDLFGLDANEFRVDGYAVGGYFYGVGMGYVNSNLTLIKIGRGIRHSMPDSERNFAYILSCAESFKAENLPFNLGGLKFKISPFDGNIDDTFWPASGRKNVRENYSIMCMSCHELIPVIPVLSHERKKQPFSNGVIEVRCRRCAVLDSYDAAMIT